MADDRKPCSRVMFGGMEAGPACFNGPGFNVAPLGLRR